MCRGACAIPCFCSQHPSFAPGSLDVTAGVLVFLYLVHNLPQLHMHIVIYSTLVSLYFAAQGDVCPGDRAAAEGPRSKPVSERRR